MNFKKWLESTQNTIHLFRGIGGPPNPMDRLGRWWSTNPYYSIRYGGMKIGQIFHASISKSDLEAGLANGSIADVTQDEYPNYVFKNSDPQSAIPMTEPEITKFRILSGELDQNGHPLPQAPRTGPGGQAFKQLFGNDAVNSAYKVYGG